MKKIWKEILFTCLLLSGIISCTNPQISSFYVENASKSRVENIVVSWENVDGDKKEIVIDSLASKKCSKYYAVMLNDSETISFDRYRIPFTITYEINGVPFDLNNSDSLKVDENGNCSDSKAMFVVNETVLIKILDNSYRIYSDD